MNWQTELIRAGVISILYLLIFVIAEVWRQMANPATEQTRKFVHLAAGVVCLSFAYIFSSHWTVLILSSCFVVIMFSTKKLGLLKSVHGVERKTSGGIYYPLAIYSVFLIAQHYNQPHYYFLSILVLAVSDSLAALIGKRYGFKVYKVEDEHKSLEGSIMFFFVTFVIALLGLLLLTPLSREVCILLAVYLSILVTGFESISLGGADNVFIPLGVMAVLIKEDNQSALHIAQQIGIVIGIIIVIFLIARRTNQLGLTAIIGIALTGYAANSLVSYTWLFPVLIGMALFSFLDIFLEDSSENDTVYRIRPVFFILLVSFIWILIADFIHDYYYLFFVPYVTNMTANMGILWQRKSRLVRRGVCSSKSPGFISHAPLFLRALILSLVLITLTAVFDPFTAFTYSLVSCLVGTILIESLYWYVEAKKRSVWKNITFLRFTALISMIVTVIQSIITLWFYKGVTIDDFPMVGKYLISLLRNYT